MFRRWGDKRMKGTVEQGAWSGGAKAQHFLLHIPRFAQPIHQTRIAVSSYKLGVQRGAPKDIRRLSLIQKFVLIFQSRNSI